MITWAIVYADTHSEWDMSGVMYLAAMIADVIIVANICAAIK